MNNYLHILELQKKKLDFGQEYNRRLNRLICGYHATQSFFRNLVKSDDNVADIGCYYGQWTYPLLSMAKEVSFIDCFDNKFPYLQKLLPPQTRNASLIKHDFAVGELGQANDKFDLIICLGTLEYVDPSNLERYCQNMLASLKAGGYLLVDMREFDKFWAYRRFILTLDKTLLVLYPARPRSMQLPIPSFFGRARILLAYLKEALRDTLVYFLKEYLSEKMLQRFKTLLKKRKGIGVVGLKQILKKQGLVETTLDDMVDMETYEMCRNLEGYNLTNTFVGNYFWLALYKKPKGEIEDD